MREDLPSGLVTLLFTDIEGSTKLLHELGETGYAEALAEHRRALRAAFVGHGGIEVDTQGDAFFYAFPDVRQACEAAREGRDALLEGSIRVRMGLHTGSPHLTPEGYVGEVVHKGARIAAAGHGGQVLLSKETREQAGFEVTDLGEHRLKDFDEPVWIFQLGTDRFPPLKTISNTNLPRPASSFVGRDGELKRVVAHLHDGVRMLTLTGPGGSGKTRLAIEAATELLSEQRNGIFWVELAPIRDPALVIDTIALTVGTKDELTKHIQEKEMMLLLDNFEQVVDAAPELPKLLAACPNLRVLVTSRELLRVRGEVEYPVPPLAQNDAVELFCERSSLEPDESIAQLCHRLDDLPLAVELAAARTSVLSPAQILERLGARLDLFKGGRDADPRQATLRSTIEWSHGLLSTNEQRLFARLSVFNGGCTLVAAQEVTGADLDTLQSLVDKSLVRHSDERFWMLETIREYALERLEESGEADALRHGHAEHFLSFVESIPEEGLRNYAQGSIAALENEHDNIRSSFDRFESVGETQSVLRFAGALAPFWRDRGFLSEGWRRLRQGLDADASPTLARAIALEGAAEFGSLIGDVAAGKRYAQEAVALSRRVGGARELGGSLQALGVALMNSGDPEAARRTYEEAVRVLAGAGQEGAVLWTKRSLAWSLLQSGEVEHARELYEEILVGALAIGDQGLVALTQDALALIAVDDGRLQDAFDLLRATLAFWRDYGDLMETPISLGRAARALAVAGKASQAARVLGCSEALIEEQGIREPWIDERNEVTLDIIREHLDDAALADARVQGRAMTAEAAVDLAIESFT